MAPKDDYDFGEIDPKKLGQSIAFSHMNANIADEIKNVDDYNPHSVSQRYLFRTGIGYCGGMCLGAIYGFVKCIPEYKMMPTAKLKFNSMTNHNVAWGARFGIVCGSLAMSFTFYEAFWVNFNF